MRIAIIGQDNYSPWQQVYAIVKRLPDVDTDNFSGTDVHIGSIPNRVGGFIEKAAKKRNYSFSPMTWQVAGNYDLVICMFMPHKEGRMPVKAAALEAHRAGTPWYAIYPDLYSDVADVVQALTRQWAKYGRS